MCASAWTYSTNKTIEARTKSWSSVDFAGIAKRLILHCHKWNQFSSFAGAESSARDQSGAALVGDAFKSLTSPASNDCNYQCCHDNCWMLVDPCWSFPTQSHTCSPEIRTGSSSFMVFMELTSICLCSWWVSSCCLSSIIFDILVIPEENTNSWITPLWELEVANILIKQQLVVCQQC